MSCGFHHCDKICHLGDCGKCTAQCGKARKLWYVPASEDCYDTPAYPLVFFSLPDHHPCEEQCHAPASCTESSPCQSLIALSCSCGRIRQSVRCNRSSTNPAGRSEGQQQPKCNGECALAKRNARLAEALGISPEPKGGPAVTYTDDVMAFAKANPKLLSLVEKALQE